MFRTLPIIRRTPLLFRRALSIKAGTANSLNSNFVQPTIFNRSPVVQTVATVPTSFLRGQILVRGAASHVSGRPGSQTAAHAAENIREEVGNSAADLAKSIAGGNVYVDSVKPTQQTFVRRFLILSIANSVVDLEVLAD